MNMKKAIQYRVKNGKAILKKLKEKYAKARSENDDSNSETESTKKEKL